MDVLGQISIDTLNGAVATVCGVIGLATTIVVYVARLAYGLKGEISKMESKHDKEWSALDTRLQLLKQEVVVEQEYSRRLHRKVGILVKNQQRIVTQVAILSRWDHPHEHRSPPSHDASSATGFISTIETDERDDDGLT